VFLFPKATHQFEEDACFINEYDVSSLKVSKRLESINLYRTLHRGFSDLFSYLFIPYMSFDNLFLSQRNLYDAQYVIISKTQAQCSHTCCHSCLW
jgi:hypothetical protein